MSTRVLSAVFVSATVLIASAYADDASAAKGRMRERVRAIDKLKLSGAVGESNRGFLEVRQESDDATRVTSAENADRQVVFSDTAARTSRNADAVGRAFAKQLAAASAAGVWLQRENGEWYRK